MRYIVWEISCGFVGMLPSSSFILSIVTWLVSLKILLCMILGSIVQRYVFVDGLLTICGSLLGRDFIGFCSCRFCDICSFIHGSISSLCIGGLGIGIGRVASCLISG